MRDEYRAYFQELLEDAPDLTPEQIDRIRSTIRNAQQEDYAA